MAETTLLVTKITFVVAEITLNLAVVTPSLLYCYYFFFIIKGCIDRLHVNIDILVNFIYLFFVRFLCGANRLYVRLSLLSHEFEQFGSLHMCAPRNISATLGLEPGTPGL